MIKIDGNKMTAKTLRQVIEDLSKKGINPIIMTSWPNDWYESNQDTKPKTIKASSIPDDGYFRRRSGVRVYKKISRLAQAENELKNNIVHGVSWNGYLHKFGMSQMVVSCTIEDFNKDQQKESGRYKSFEELRKAILKEVQSEILLATCDTTVPISEISDNGFFRNGGFVYKKIKRTDHFMYTQGVNAFGNTIRLHKNIHVEKCTIENFCETYSD